MTDVKRNRAPEHFDCKPRVCFGCGVVFDPAPPHPRSAPIHLRGKFAKGHRSWSAYCSEWCEIEVRYERLFKTRPEAILPDYFDRGPADEEAPRLAAKARWESFLATHGAPQ